MKSVGEEYVENGSKLLLESHDSMKFFPPIFFHSKIEGGERGSKKYKISRTSSEAELLVYRAFTAYLKQSELYKDSIVMHSFYYNRSMLDELKIQGVLNQENNKRNKIEHDFVILLNTGVILIVEVKNKKSGNASKQLRIAESFVNKVCGVYKLGNPIIIKVKAFPFRAENKGNEATPCDQNVHVLYRDTINKESEFSLWWENKIATVRGQPVCNHKEISGILLGIWLRTNNYRATISQVINTIDRRLKEADLSQGKENRVMTDSIISNSISRSPYKYITNEQFEVLNETKYKKCVIRGPAGTGKTVAMIINVMRLIQMTGEEKLPIVIIAYNKACADILVTCLKSCGVKNSQVQLHCLQQLKPDSELDSSKDVIIIYMDFITGTVDGEKLKNILQKIGQFHLFIDNWQNFMVITMDFSPLLAMLEKTDQYFWILVDEMQNPIVSKAEEVHEDFTQLFISEYRQQIEEKVLTKIVRSTKEITEASKSIRDMIYGIDTGNRRDDFKIECDSLHFIHGVKPSLHILTYNTDGDKVIENLKTHVNDYIEEYKKKYRQFGHQSAIFYNFMPGSQLRKWDFLPSKRNAEDLQNDNATEGWTDFKYIDTLYSMAHEFTTVLGLLYIVKDNNFKYQDWLFRNLYITLTRARVIADIFVICENFEIDTKKFEDNFEFHTTNYNNVA